MKRKVTLVMILIFFAMCFSGFASAYTCPSGSHTFSGGTQASGAAMCIPDIGASGPVSGSGSGTSGSSGSSAATTTTSDGTTDSTVSSTVSTKDTITPSGSASDISQQGRTMDSQVDSEVYKLYGTSAYAQAKKLYDDSVAVNWDDYDAVASQTKNADYDTAVSLQRAYNIRALNRLNAVWTEIIALEETLDAQQKEERAEQARQGVQNAQEQENQNQEESQQSDTQYIPQFQSMIDFNSNFMPMTMTLSQSQIQMLGGLPPAKVKDLFHSVQDQAIANNPSLKSLGTANLGASPLANKLNRENPNVQTQIQKGVSLNSQGVGNFMNQQIQSLLGGGI